MQMTWNDLSGTPTRWWGLPALMAMRRDHLGAIAAQQRFGDLVRLQIVNERTVDVFVPFRPERFMAASDDWHPDPIPRGAYIPFGLGPRVCLGQHLAQLEMTVIAALLLQRFRLATLTDTPPTPLLAVTLRPAGGVPLILEARQ